jgi:hypothetical protein
MKTNTLKLTATALIPTALLGLAGCGTAPVNPLTTQSSPTLAGGLPVVETFDQKAEVASLVPAQRTVALRSKAGKTITCKTAPQVANYSQLQVGDRVKAKITDAVAIFLVKDGQPPSAAAGVAVAGPAEAGQPAGVVLQTTDSHAKVCTLDVSYGMLKLDYGNGTMKEFKVPRSHSLKQVQKGDEVVVRATEPLALCLEPR